MKSSKRTASRTEPKSTRLELTPTAKRNLLLMAGLFLLAFLFRLWGIRWGLPNEDHSFSYHPDEWIILIASYFVLNPYAGEWLPGFYNYGSLPLYLWSVWLHWLTTVGVIPTLSESPTAMEIAQLRASLHFWARVLVALFGAGTAVAVAQTARRALVDERAGLIAGLAIALAPAFVVHSRFQTVDVPTTFFVALTLYQSVALLHSERPWRTLIWGAVWAGCAAGCKYNAGLVALALMVGWGVRVAKGSGQWAVGSGERSGQSVVGRRKSDKTRPFLFPTPYSLLPTLQGILATVGVSVGVFLLVCPGALWDSEKFWRDFSYEVRHVQQGHGEIFTNTGPGWWYHLVPNLTTGFTFIGVLFGLAGWAFQGWRYRSLWGVVAFSLAYYLLIGSAEVRFMRYTLPLFPMLALGVGLYWRYVTTSSLSPLLVGEGQGVRVEGEGHGRDARATEGEGQGVRAEGEGHGRDARATEGEGQGVGAESGEEQKMRAILLSPTMQKVNRLIGLLPLLLVLMSQLLYSVSYTLCMVRSDARDQALAWMRENLPTGASIGFATVPWFYTPPLFPETGELRWQDRLQKMQEAKTPLRLISLAPPEWDADALYREKPDYLVLSEFEWRDVARTRNHAYLRFRKWMERDYERIQQFENEPPLGRSKRFPHDMLYICPKIEVWKRR